MKPCQYFTFTSFVSATIAVNIEFPGFTHFANWDGGHDMLSNMPQDFQFSRGSSMIPSMQKDLCAYEPGCDMFTEWKKGEYRSLRYNSTYDIYLGSDVTKFSSSVCSNETGGLYIPSQQYLKCSHDFGHIKDGQILNHFQLPPSLIHSSCLQDSRCVGFRIKNDQSGGDTIGLVSWDSMGYFKIPRASRASEKARIARTM